MTDPIMVSVAGSDPSGGAGIQADLKTATALGVYGGAVITSLTVQNTRGVSGIHPVPADFVADQLAAVLDDLDVAAIKIGMLATPEIAAAVAAVLHRHPVPAIVLDPVMVSTSGDRLVAAEATAVIKDELLPLATVITPNLPETATLLGVDPPRTVNEMQTAALALRNLGCAALVKGGHLTEPGPGKGSELVDEQETVLRQAQDSRRQQDQGSGKGGLRSIDVLADDAGTISYVADRVETANTHGTGCTLSSAIAAELARGCGLRTAISRAKEYLTGALRSGSALRIGSGSGPVDHLWRNR